MWWCEGEKTTKYVKFTRFDTSLVTNCLALFRKGFMLGKEKFRALVHIHNYHDNQTQNFFWNKLTNIPLPQFHKSYKKSSTHTRNRDDYSGCITISYCDAKIAKELKAVYNAFTVRGIR